jgi:hypothetical protein
MVDLEFGSIGSTAIVGNLIDAGTLTTGNALSLTEKSLPAGPYFLILSITSGNAVWEGSTSAMVTTSSGVTHSIDFSASPFDTGFPPDSNFSPVLTSDRFYQVTTSPASVPEPGTTFLLPAGAATLLALKRRRPGSR